ncbi:MAG: hypothetical protein Q7S95_00185 [bacterium]|nr:hypothetical protein [bacterium]
MTAVLDGMTPLAFVRGEVKVKPTELAPKDWIQLIDDAMEGVSWSNIGAMMPIGELLSRRYAGPRDPEVRCQVVSPTVLKKIDGQVPPGARFLYINRLSRPTNPMSSADLLFGQEFERGSTRTWCLYTLGVEWRWMRPRELSGSDQKGFAATRIILHGLPPDEVLELFRIRRDAEGHYESHNGFVVARGVLQRIRGALAEGAIQLERNAREAHGYARRVAGILERVSGIIPQSEL